METVNPAALQPLNPETAAAIEAATGCSIAELLATAEPAWDVLARFVGPMLGLTQPLPDTAWQLSNSGQSAAQWAAAIGAAGIQDITSDE